MINSGIIFIGLDTHKKFTEVVKGFKRKSR